MSIILSLFINLHEETIWSYLEDTGFQLELQGVLGLSIWSGFAHSMVASGS